MLRTPQIAMFVTNNHTIMHYPSLHLELPGHQVKILVSSLGQSASSLLRRLDKSHRLEVVEAVTNDVSVGLRLTTRRKHIHGRGTDGAHHYDDENRRHHAETSHPH